MAINSKPLGDRVLVEPAEEKETKKGGIIILIPRKKPNGRHHHRPRHWKDRRRWQKVPFEVKKGDRVLVSKYGGTEIKLDGKEYKSLTRTHSRP